MAFSRQVVSVIAATMLAAHVVVGCCAHHDHPQAGDGELPGLHRLADHHDGGGPRCCHHGADPAAPSHEGQPGDHSCGQGTCSFLAGSKIVVPDLTEPAGVDAVSSEMRLNQIAPWSIASDQLFERLLAPHLRSHLSKCVLLI